MSHRGSSPGWDEAGSTPNCSQRATTMAPRADVNHCSAACTSSRCCARFCPPHSNTDYYSSPLVQFFLFPSNFQANLTHPSLYLSLYQTALFSRFSTSQFSHFQEFSFFSFVWLGQTSWHSRSSALRAIQAALLFSAKSFAALSCLGSTLAKTLPVWGFMVTLKTQPCLFL